ncbi:MAG: indolepyruvate ferredoxin oxidoreductase family protein [Burkholderiales bacterium]|nr:indolepyruvate ferredoxin oxidoreductase family protein [Burkholderiales bacterium]
MSDRPLLRPAYQLSDNLWAEQGSVFITGTQALLRVLLMQRRADELAGLATQGFLSGYRGSPLGAVDQQVWKAGERFAKAGIRFLPAVNEELGATAVLGTQRVEGDPERSCDGVFAMWYGKGPGVDRAADALHHGNAYGSSPHGGVVAVAGDDHGCVSSSMPHQSDAVFTAFGMPVLAPADVSDLIEFGLYGFALSRYCGAWVGMAAPSEVVESSATVDIDRILARCATWVDAAAIDRITGHKPPPGGLHHRDNDRPSPELEVRLAAKRVAASAFASVNTIDRDIIASPQARVGILTAGKAHHDLMEVLRRLAITPAQLAAAGVRVRKLGLVWPLESQSLRAFAKGLHEVLVIEEKAGLVEDQLRALFYNAAVRPRIVGKHDALGAPLVSAIGELRPSRLIEIVAAWLARHDARLDRHEHVRDFTVPELLSNIADGVKRQPYYCAGCPHNTSTVVPAGSQARAGIGCHVMATWMERDTTGFLQMGGEGVDWVSQAMFSKRPHMFQNLGDGTYFHSGYLAIRQAVAAKATITYKILYNDAVAMTGGQPVDGGTSVDAIARQVESEGVAKVVVLSDDIGKYAAIEGRFPAGTEFHERHALDEVQRRLREIPGVTVLIYEQTCAAEKRRRRKKGVLADPPRRLFINEAVCEGCGDCSLQSNCVAVLPQETPLGRKRRIDQSACNKDYRCLDGFCPSFVSVSGGQPRRHSGLLDTQREAFLQRVQALPLPPLAEGPGPYDLLVTGVGGTGVVTVGALITMAAHLEGLHASVLDFMGFAQKGGAVMSYVRVAREEAMLNQVRIDAQQCDAVLACDLVVAAAPEALQTMSRGRTRVLANTHPTPVAESVRHPDAQLHVPALLAKLHFAVGRERVQTFDAQALALDFLGDTLTANIVALGYAWQRGLVPVGLAALRRAIELNGVAVDTNQLAFALGRLAAAQPQALAALREPGAVAGEGADEDLPALLERAHAHLAAWQNRAWAERFARTMQDVQTRERALGGDAALPFSKAVARSLLKLMSYKDEYEVARLFTDGSFTRALHDQFEGEPKVRFHMAPPLLVRPRHGKPPQKMSFGPWLMPLLRLLARGKRLRGSVFDPFGHTHERRLERQLITDFEARVAELLQGLTAERLALATAIAEVPLLVRGYGHVKLANLAIARAREAELLHRFDPARHPQPQPQPQPPAPGARAQEKAVTTA